MTYMGQRSDPAVVMQRTTLTVVLSQDETVHAPQSKHVQEVPGRRAHPACSNTNMSNQEAGQTERDISGVGLCAAHQEASRDSRSIPLCSMGLNLSVRGNGILAVRQNQTG